MNPKPTRIPLLVKLVYTAFAAVLVYFYTISYGPTNFLYFCDVALLMGVLAIWLESSLLASAPTIGILLPQLLWQIDFLGGLFGLGLTGMTGYMFDPSLSLLTRGLSFFHFWLPLFLLWVLWHLGYDRRAFRFWTVLAWGLILVCYFVLPAPPAPKDNPNLPVNVNYVYGLSDKGPQTWMDQRLYFALLFVGLPILMYLPAHLLCCWLFRPPDDKDTGAGRVAEQEVP